MVLYSIIMFLVAIPMFRISMAIYKGKTSLIHDYHQAKVTDRLAYGKAFGKSMFIVSTALLLSGIAGLLSDSEAIAAFAVAILFIGLLIGIARIIAVQKKYNNGIFSFDGE